MSVAVSLERLGEQLQHFGDWPYVITVSADGQPHAVSVEVAWDGAVFAGSPGRTTAANAVDRPAAVTLLWTPYEPGGYSLIVDATGSAGPDGIVLTPVTAVLHRTGPPRADSPPSCTSDCVRV